MAFVRFIIDGGVPETTYDALPSATKADIWGTIRKLKSFCRKINEGQPNEENTVKFEWHICRHDENLPCDPEQDI